MDVHFTPSTHGITNILGAATSTGSIALYSLNSPIKLDTPNPISTHSRLQHIRTVQLFDPSEIVTSLNWHPLQPGILATTLSTGAVHLCQVNTPNEVETSHDRNTDQDTATTILSHDLEAWIAVSTPQGTGLLTGGDDSTLRFRSLPPPELLSNGIENALESHQSNTWIDRKSHTAGVTAILPLTSQLVLTGSYDDHIRLISTPEIGPRRVLLEENLGGGVWRLRLLHDHVDADGVWELEVLASCMHVGVRVLRIRRSQDGKWELLVMASFEEHASMNYGSDLQIRGGEEGRFVVSTSFYDRLVCLWRIPEG